MHVGTFFSPNMVRDEQKTNTISDFIIKTRVYNIDSFIVLGYLLSKVLLVKVLLVNTNSNIVTLA